MDGIKSLMQVAEIELSYKNPVPPSDRIKVTNSIQVYDVLRNHWSEQIDLLEEFVILLLDRAQHVLGLHVVSKGGTAGTVVDPKLVFISAIRTKASSIILAHNHPSGNLKPSQADLSLTNRLVQGGTLLDVKVIDHLIITAHGYFSFADEGLI